MSIGDSQDLTALVSGPGVRGAPAPFRAAASQTWARLSRGIVMPMTEATAMAGGATVLVRTNRYFKASRA